MSAIPPLEREAMSDPQPYPAEAVAEGEQTWLPDEDPPDQPVPPHLKEISPLASWTVSTYKPSCGVAALRNPSMEYYWQSDGPQPHILNVHFFKLVAISHMRFYIDSKYDESYTPTKMQFLAGTGHHDLQTVCEMDLPPVVRGWQEVDLSHAGGPPALKEGEFIDDDEDDEDEQMHGLDLQHQQAYIAAKRARHAWRRIGTGPTLRCFLVQVKILENNQNGKDTHLRGLQLFARDESYRFGKRRRPRPSAVERQHMEELSAGLADNMTEGPVTRARAARKARASIALETATSATPSPANPSRHYDPMEELELRFGDSELR